MRIRTPLVSLLAALALPVVSFASPYRLEKRIPLPGEGGWDYLTVDSAARRVYVTHSERVAVIDADKLVEVGSIDGLDRIHGVALAPDLGRGFVSNGGADKVTVFDSKTLAKLAEAPTGKNPDAILYDPATKRVFAFNGRSDSATVIDAASAKVVGEIPLGGKPEFAASDGAGGVFVNLEDKSLLARIDPRRGAAGEVTDRWPLGDCEEPSGLALDREAKRLYAGCGNGKMAVVDAASGRLVTTLPICHGIDATVFDAGSRQVFDSCGDGNVTIYRAGPGDRFTLVATVPTQRGSRTMALDPVTGRLFFTGARFEPVAPSAAEPHPRPHLVAGSVELLVFAPEGAAAKRP